MQNISFDTFSSRSSRARFVAHTFSEELKRVDSILDVGCWNKDLKSFLPDQMRYVGIDIAGNPDVCVDLEDCALPFGDNAFQMVIATEVLEHLDDPYCAIQELFRCSNKYVLVSLPNAYAMFMRRRILAGKPLKFYGLPPNAPEDRHKWFFSYEEGKDFIHHQAKLAGNWTPFTEFVHFGKVGGLKGLLRHGIIKLMPARSKNLFVTSYWCLLEKRE